MLEIAWSVIPLLACIAIFFWGVDGFMKFSVAPGEALEIQVRRQEMAVAVRVSGRIAHH
jgi:hypothetical protein